MVHYALKTFIAVADCGSFTKAAERLYISPTAVMKQMNTLEKHLDLALIERTSSGVRLTEAGKVIYRDAKFIIDYADKSVANARAALRAADTTFCVGTSLLNPAKPFMDLWYRVNQDFPAYKLHLVPFEDDHEGKMCIRDRRYTDLKELDEITGYYDEQVGVYQDVYFEIGLILGAKIAFQIRAKMEELL